MRPNSVMQRLAKGLALGVLVLGATSCGEVARTGRAPVLLVIDTLEAASGATPDDFANTLLSDVQTLVPQTVGTQTVRVPTIFNDLGRVNFRMTLKNPGTSASPLGPSALNEVTVTRYRVTFTRTDGRNTPGVDVPYGFDGAFTVTIPASGGSASAGFDLVRHQAKSEPPLRNLVGGGSARFISTIAEVTFYGRDQAGNEVIASGTISVNFGDWADPS